MGQNPVEVKDLFAVFDENFVLTNLTHPADVVFLDADGIAEDVSAFAAGDARATRDSQRASATQIAEADVVECGDHLFTFHGNKVSEKSAWVKRFLQKKSKKNRTKKLDENLDGWV